jgi:hypothetical protein
MSIIAITTTAAIGVVLQLLGSNVATKGAEETVLIP